MKCRKCGAEISEGAKFCEMCGARVEIEENETPVTTEEAVNDSPAEAVSEAATESASFATEKTEFSPIPEEPVKKKKPVWAIVAAGLVGVIAILAVLVCCSKVAGNTFRKIFLSPEKYLAYVLKENFGESIDDGLTVYDEYINRVQNPDNVESTVKFDVALGDEFSEYVAEYAGEYTSDADWVTWIKKASLEYNVNSYQGDSVLGVKVGANDVDLASVLVSVSADGHVYFSVPEVLTKPVYIKLEPEQVEEFIKIKDMTNAIYKELPTKPELQSISKKYLKAIFDNIDGVKRTNEVLTVEDVSDKATVLTMELDDIIITNMEIDVLEEFLQDEEYEKIWMRVYDAYEEFLSDTNGSIPDKAESYEEIKKNAQEALDRAKEKLESLESGELENSVKATVKFYVDKKGSLSGCGVYNENFEMSYIQPAKAGRFGTEIEMKGLGESGDFNSITIIGTGKESANVITADLTASVDGERLFDIVINNIDKSIQKKGEGSFDVAITNVNFDEASKADLAVLNDIIGDTNIGFYYKGSVSKNSGNATLSLGNGEKDLFSVGCTVDIKEGSAKTFEGKDSAIEFDMNDEAVIVELIKAVDADAFVANLKSAGANEDLVATIESGLAYVKSLVEYY